MIMNRSALNDYEPLSNYASDFNLRRFNVVDFFVIVEARYGLTDNAFHVILHIADPPFLSYIELHDVTSIIWQSLRHG
jgi:hypothetical protein